MSILGIHHISLVSSDAQRTLDFYTQVLGLRLLKRTVNLEDPTSYHLYFGTEEGTPLVSVVESREAAAGNEGVGGTHHFALSVEDRDLLLQWKRWFTSQGLQVNGPLDRHYFQSLYIRDPDGTVIELATRGPGWTRDEEPDRIGTEHRPPPPEMVTGNRDTARIQAETWPEPIPAITREMRFQRMHHITAIGNDIERTHAFVHEGLGLRRVKRTSNFDMPDSYHWYWGVGEGEPGTVVTYFERKGATPVRHGPGQAAHYALSVVDEAGLELVRKRLLSAGFAASEVKDRVYFKSFLTEDPHGQVVEIATNGPGFTVDEAEDALGQTLVLPPSLEGEQARIEGALRPLTTSQETSV